MANGSIKDSASGNVTIAPGLRTDIMRNLMETKNTLANKGSIYVGTGNSHTMGPSDDLVTICETKELETGGAANAKKVLTIANDGGLGYQYVTEASFGATGASGVFKGLVEKYSKELTINTGATTTQKMSIYQKTYTNYDTLMADTDLAKSMTEGAGIISAVLRIRKTEGSRITDYKLCPVMFTGSSILARGLALGSVFYFDSDTANWVKITGDATTFNGHAGTLKVTYIL